jgi:putative ABC transport system permease protein
VTHAAGTYPETFALLAPAHTAGGQPVPGTNSRLTVPHGQVNLGAVAPGKALAVVGRAGHSGPLDDLALQQGRWATKPGQIVVDPRLLPFPVRIGNTVTVASAPGKPKLTVVGYASSIGRDEAAWVTPGQVAALRPAGAPAQVSADLATVKAAVPRGADDSWVSWLSSEGLIAAAQGINTPFVVAFAVIALVLAALITASLAAAVVVASYLRIGVLKSVGFTPAQVTAIYVAQISLPALADAIAGAVLGNQQVLALINGGSSLFNLTVVVPQWINIAAPLAMLALARAAAAVTAGLAAPLARPAPSAVTLAAITFGLTAVVLATGLDSSLAKISHSGPSGVPRHRAQSTR